MTVKKMAAQFGLTGCIAMAAVFATLPAHAAFGLPDVALPGSGSKASNVDVGGLLSQQKDLMGRFNQSMNNMLVAQALTLQAGGLKDQADAISAAANNYKQGAVQSKDQLERDTQLSKNATETINGLIKKNASLSAEGQAKLVSAVPHYAVGMYEGTKLPQSFKSWTESAKSGVNSLTADPLNAGKLTSGLGDVTTVATNLPTLVSTWTATSKAFLSYAKSNKVDTKDLSSKMGDI